MQALIGLVFFFAYWLLTVIGILLVVTTITFFENDFKVKPLKINGDIALGIFVIGLVAAGMLSLP